MLAERADAICHDIATLKGLEILAELIAKLRTRASQLQEAVNALRPLAAALKLFRQLPIPVDTTTCASDARMLKARATELLSAVEAGPEDFATTADEFRLSFWSKIKPESYPQDVRDALTSAWVAYVNRSLPLLESQILDILGAIPQFAKQVGRIRLLQEQAARCREQLPTSAGDFQRFEQIAQGLRSAWQDLVGEGIPEEVLRFLRAAVGRGARMSMLTARVSDWLKEHGLDGTLRIILGDRVATSLRRFGSGNSR